MMLKDRKKLRIAAAKNYLLFVTYFSLYLCRMCLQKLKSVPGPKYNTERENTY